jgi:beta-galactosidase
MKVEPAGKALIANNHETLAWIAGPAGNFTDKTHSYGAGATVAKQVVLINDTRQEQKAACTWTARMGGKVIGGKSLTATVPPGKTVQIPFGFKLPGALHGEKTEGIITLSVSIGGRKHNDTFTFRAFASTASEKGSVWIFDPRGSTTMMLKSLGYTVQPWDGKARDRVVVIGREALSGGGKLPGDLKAFVNGGGRAVIFNQNPEWMQDSLGWRVAPRVSRRVFPLPGRHPVSSGLDAQDFQDWAGTSNLVAAYPQTSQLKKAPHNGPYHGWRWGNRHMVSSAPIEKPHRSGWRPILESEFDLAYTPLMELDYGKGRLIWCGLDLEEHVNVDPAARRVAAQLMRYAATARLSPRAASVRYLGGQSGATLLDSLGVRYTPAQKLDNKIALTLLGPDADVSDAAIREYVQQGGRVAVLPGTSENAPLAAKRVSKADFIGSLDVPAWPEAAGLSAGDLRYRAPSESWLLAKGGGLQVGAGGLLGRQSIGKGVVLWVQIDPRRFNADEKTYLRFTRWRSTRALSQVLANLGASFKADSQVFHPRSRSEGTVSLTGRWAAKWVQRIPDPSQQRHADTGTSDSARAMMGPAMDDTQWERLPVPGMWESAGGNWDAANGEVVYRMTVELPATVAGKDMLLSLGKIDDRDETWFNGQKVGGSQGTDSEYSVDRKYVVPGALVKAGRNVIAVRVWDSFGGGGISGPAQDMFLRPAQGAAFDSYYHSDYIEEFDMGDDPYRYYNW